MVSGGSIFWKKNPFLRLFWPTASGVITGWYAGFPVTAWWITALLSLSGLTAFFFIPFFKRFRFFFLNIFLVSTLFMSFGALLVWKQDIRHDPLWLERQDGDYGPLVVSLDEPLVEKTKSYKAVASAAYLLRNKMKHPVRGSVILYFKKDSTAGRLTQGSRVLLNKRPEPIRNAGNPGGFDYKRYCLFQGITHQVYLTPGEFEILPGKNETALKTFLFAAREKVLHILRTHIRGEKETGLAEALLIGYKNDLDQALVQSYTNTGVVHIIAISGLHLGLIYWILVWLLAPLKRTGFLKWLRPLLIIAGLWLFSLLAGAQPSVLRSALMFSCIVAAECMGRRTSIFNTLAASAFIQVLINPFILWDIGFQLSYAAVTSIVIFMRPVYNLFYVKNRMLDFVWKLNAVTISAQLLTTPLAVYHFHQFPTWFLLSNLLAVPLSSLVLLGEIVLCIIHFIPFAAPVAGECITALIRLMNAGVGNVEALPFSVWDGMQINGAQVILFFLLITLLARWLTDRRVLFLKAGLCVLLLMIGFRSYSFIRSGLQQKIIVYNVPKKSAIDFIMGRTYVFKGDRELQADGFARNFHLKPSRVYHRTGPSAVSLPDHNGMIGYAGKRILWLDKPLTIEATDTLPPIDLLIIAKNQRADIIKLATVTRIRQVVFDGSVPAWRSGPAKKVCDSLGIAWHDVADSGAFVMNLR